MEVLNEAEILDRYTLVPIPEEPSVEDDLRQMYDLDEHSDLDGP